MRSAETARRAAVIGGGLLGLEAARGLLNWGLETHVIHLMPHLMEAQLDPGAADVLRRQFEQMGLVTKSPPARRVFLKRPRRGF